MESRKLRCVRRTRGAKRDLTEFILWFENHDDKYELMNSSKRRIQLLYEEQTGGKISQGVIGSVRNGEYLIIDNKIYKLYSTFNEEEEEKEQTENVN